MGISVRRLLLDVRLGGRSLAKHDDGVAFHDGDAAEAFARLEGVDDERLLRLEAAGAHLTGFDVDRLLDLLATSLLAHLPVDGGELDGGAAGAHEGDRAVAGLQFPGVVEDLDGDVEVGRALERGVRVADHRAYMGIQAQALTYF